MSFYTNCAFTNSFLKTHAFYIFLLYTSLTALMHINRDSFFNFGNLDDYNHTGFKYSTFSITVHKYINKCGFLL